MLLVLCLYLASPLNKHSITHTTQLIRLFTHLSALKLDVSL